MTPFRLTEKRKNLINTLAQYVSTDKATDDLSVLFRNGYNYKNIKNMIDAQREKWNILNVLRAFELVKQNPNKQSRLQYNPEYISAKHCLSMDDAKIYITNFKKRKSTSKEGFIMRHGHEKGDEMFRKFQQTSKLSSDNLKNQLLGEYGIDEYQEKCSLEYRRRSKASPEFYIFRESMSPEDAIEKAREWNINNAGISKTYYINKGYTEDEIDAVLSSINIMKGKTSRNRNFLKDKYGDSWIFHYEKTMTNYRKTMEELDHWLPVDKIKSYRDYKQIVWFWTRQTLHFNKIPLIEKRNLNYHLDHMYSIKEGFIQNVNPKIIASVYNLKIITQSENCKKRANCTISLNTLLNLYHENKNN